MRATSPDNSDLLPTADVARLQEEVQFWAQFAAATIDAISAHLCVLDKTGQIVAVNAAWRKFYDDNSAPGTDTQHYGVGTNYLRICQDARNGSANEAGPVAAGVRAVIHRDMDRFSLEYPCHSPTEQRWFNLVVTPFQGASGHVVVSHENISQRKRYEVALVKAKEVAEAANRAKSDFLATMSHEIRTPMNGILGMTQLLLAPEVSAQERVDYAQTILHSSQILLELLNDILDLSKIEARQITLERRIFSPRLLLSEILTLYAESARRKGLVLNATCQLAETSVQFWGDPLRLRQILTNLLNNAIKFTDRGQVNIRLSSGAEHEKGKGKTHALRFTVSDTGIGIPPDERDRLFKTFSQANPSISRRFGGTGLGLSIIKHLVELMGGQVGVDSRPGVGSAFWFELSLECADVEPSPALEACGEALSPNSPPHLPPKSKRVDAHFWHILVVEDTLINRELLEILLRKQGYQVSAVSNGQLAVDWVLHRRTPDLILMDCHMPVMDGLQATRLIRAWEQQTARPRPLPIIALTANAFDNDRRQCLAAGMNEFLSKPFHFNDLYALLEHLLPASNMSVGTLASAPPLAPADSLPPINLPAALDRMDGDWATFLHFAAALPAQIAQDQAAIGVAAQGANPTESLCKVSHRLKSVLGMLGAERAQAACLALEVAAKQQMSTAYPILIQELDAALAALSPALEDLLVVSHGQKPG